MKFRKVLSIGIALSALTGITYAEELKAAPNFKAKDANGVEHSLTQYKGKVLVLHFTNPGSPTSGKDGCPYEVPRYEKKVYQGTANKVKSAGGIYLAVNSTSYNTAQDSLDIAKKYAVNFDTLIDSDGIVGKAYQARSTPHIFVINKDGKLVYDGAFNDNATPDASKDATAKNYLVEAVTAANKGTIPEVSKTRSYGCGIKYKQ